MCPGAKPFADEIALPFWRCGQVRIRLVLIEKNTSEGAKTVSLDLTVKLNARQLLFSGDRRWPDAIGHKHCSRNSRLPKSMHKGC